MPKLTKLRIRNIDGRTEVVALVRHTKQIGSAQSSDTVARASDAYIERMTFELNDVLVAEAHMGPDVARNALTGISLDRAESGDKVAVYWVDSRGETGSATARIGQGSGD